MEKNNDKVQDYLIDRIKKLEKENNNLIKELYNQTNTETKLAIDIRNKAAEKIIDYISILILDGTNGYWQHFRSNGSEYMTDEDLENLLIYVKEKTMEKVENNELWN